MRITRIKGKKLEKKINEINKRILLLTPNIHARSFPIYIRYLKGDEIFALLYVPTEEYIEVGLNINEKIHKDFEDAEWMKYDNIKYSIKFYEDTNIEEIFKVLEKYFKNDKSSKK